MEKSTGIKTTGADTWVATFRASEEAEGHERVVQITALTSGKIDSTLGTAYRNVDSNDSMDVSFVIGDIEIGDNAYIACYIKHSQPSGSCLVTPLLCDGTGAVVGNLESKISSVKLPIMSGSDYLSQCLSWKVIETGAWKLFIHITDLSITNTIDVWCFAF